MTKTAWKLNYSLPAYRGQVYIERKWLFDDKPPLIERKLINSSEIPFYIIKTGA